MEIGIFIMFHSNDGHVDRVLCLLALMGKLNHDEYNDDGNDNHDDGDDDENDVPES